MTRPRLVAAILAGLIVTGLWVLLPPRARQLTLASDPLVWRGALHVHTVRSDGAGTIATVAAAARRAGLDFVVLTDHGDGTRAPEPPRYLGGVLLIDGVEISTTGGHYVALGIGQAPYRLAGEPRDVIDDVHRLGGFGIAAHPDSPKQALRWREWQARFDGIEWLNEDSQWRDESGATLLRALLTYWLRGPETIVSLFDRPELNLARWDAASVRRRVVGVAGHDAHARLPLGRDVEQGDASRALGLPSYTQTFRTFAVRVRLEAPPGRTPESAARDQAAVLGAIREGRTYTVIDALAGPAELEFWAVGSQTRAAMGAEIADTGAVTLTADLRPSTPGATMVLYRNGIVAARHAGPHLEAVHPAADGPATYRVEVDLEGAPGTPPVPWIVGNPIYVTRGIPRSVIPLPWRVTAERELYPGETAAVWTVERHTASEGRVEEGRDPAGARGLHFTWRLSGGPKAGQYAALVRPISGPELSGYDQLTLTAASHRPMRASIQVRIPEGGGLRWQRSVYLAPSPRTIVIPLREMTPVEAPVGARLDLRRADTLLVVVDTVNASPGSSGGLWLTRVAVQRTALADRAGSRALAVRSAP
jgi:hypothetical protein